MWISRNWKKYYEYRSNDTAAKILQVTESDWPFPETYNKSIGSTVRGFSFFSQLIWFSEKFNPTSIEFNKHWNRRNMYCSNTMFILSRPTANWRKHTYYNNVLQKYFINESYFSYDKSDLIKGKYITVLNNKISIYSSISYFNKKNWKWDI